VIFEAKEAILFGLVLSSFLCMPLKHLMSSLRNWSLFVKLQVTAVPCFRNLVWVFENSGGCASLPFHLWSYSVYWIRALMCSTPRPANSSKHVDEGVRMLNLALPPK